MSRVLNVLLVEMCEDGTVGGSHRLLYDLAMHLDRTRFRPIALFYQNNSFAGLLASEGVPVHVWDDARRLERKPRGILGRAAQMASGIARRVSFIREQEIDVVHLNNIPTQTIELWWPACRLTSTRLVAHIRGPVLPTAERFDWFRRQLASRCDHIISSSKHIGHTAIKGGLSPRNMRLVYDGLDLAQWTPLDESVRVSARRDLGIPSNDLAILIPANLKRWKGQLDALKAIELLPRDLKNRCHVLIAGGVAADQGAQAYAQEVRVLAGAMAAEGGPRVSFLGPREDMPELYSAADVVVHCSIEPEPFGTAVLEALAMGRPVIASALGGPAEMLPADSGALADPRDHRQFSAALERVLGDESVRTALALLGREQMVKFDLRRSVEQTARAYLGQPNDVDYNWRAPAA